MSKTSSNSNIPWFSKIDSFYKTLYGKGKKGGPGAGNMRLLPLCTERLE